MDCGGIQREIHRQTAARPSACWNALTVLSLSVFVCSGFTVSASAAVLLFGQLTDVVADGPSTPRLILKVVLFSIVFAFSLAALLLLRQRECYNVADPRSRNKNRKAVPWLVASIAIAALVAFPRLRVYPHIEPDEAHHLVVARNLALHGVYGSGMPVTGFHAFDDYDSVGPTVIVPVAGAIRLTGGVVGSGRVIMALFYVVLTVVAFLLIREYASPIHACVAAMFLLLVPGSIYLARTLYGEVPAMAFLIAALLVWSSSLRSSRPLLPCAVSGGLFGCALLTKFILVIAVWPALGMWMFDWMTRRSIRPIHALVPAGVAVAMLAAWVVVTSVYSPQGNAASSYLNTYTHHLLFGVKSVDVTAAWLVRHWIAAAVYLGAGFISAAVISMRAPNMPVLLFLTLFAQLNMYWWFFFTTGNIPRYLWFSMALGALFAGWAWTEFVAIWAKRPHGRKRAAAIVFASFVPLLVLWDALPRLTAVAAREEMRDEYAVVDLLRSNFAKKKVATTFYPIERVANLLAEIPVTRVRPAGSWSGYDAVVIDRTSQPDAARRKTLAAVCGRYVIIEPDANAP